MPGMPGDHAGAEVGKLTHSSLGPSGAGGSEWPALQLNGSHLFQPVALTQPTALTQVSGSQPLQPMVSSQHT